MSTEVRMPDGRPAQAQARRGPGQAGQGGGQQVSDSRQPPRPARQRRPGRPPQPGRQASPVRPSGPGRPGRPPRTGGPGRPAQQLRQDPQLRQVRPPLGGSTGPRGKAGPLASVGPERSGITAASVRRHGRSSFVLLVLGLLSGGLICLLVVQTTFAAASIRISRLEQRNAAQTQQVQELRQQITMQETAAVLQREAARLGMRPAQTPSFVDVRTHKIVIGSSAVVGLPGSNR